jgi:hypothetical protein
VDRFEKHAYDSDLKFTKLDSVIQNLAKDIDELKSKDLNTRLSVVESRLCAVCPTRQEIEEIKKEVRFSRMYILAILFIIVVYLNTNNTDFINFLLKTLFSLLAFPK